MESGTVTFTLMEMFRLGGVFMWPLLAFSIVTITIGIERLIYLLYHNLKIDDLGVKVSEMMAARDYQGAKDFLSAQTGRRMGARILLALVNRATPAEGKAFSEHHLERAVETEAMICINSLEKGFNFLVALGSLSPLTGFLGTVSGMIGAFKSIAEATEVNAQIVANGIYEALITTVCGLVIAIVAMIFHSVFTHMVNNFTAGVEKNCSDLIADIAIQEEK